MAIVLKNTAIGCPDHSQEVMVSVIYDFVFLRLRFVGKSQEIVSAGSINEAHSHVKMVKLTKPK